MGKFDVRFEKTTLKALATAAGLGTMHHRGDAGESLYWLCYTIRGGTTAERLWIVAHGEMGGSEHAVTMVSAQELAATARPSADCPALPPALQPLSFPQGLWLGTPEGEALKALGRPSLRKGAWRSFAYEGKERGDCEPDGFDVLNWLAFEAVQGRIRSIAAGQVTSC